MIIPYLSETKNDIVFIEITQFYVYGNNFFVLLHYFNDSFLPMCMHFLTRASNSDENWRYLYNREIVFKAQFSHLLVRSNEFTISVTYFTITKE